MKRKLGVLAVCVVAAAVTVPAYAAEQLFNADLVLDDAGSSRTHIMMEGHEVFRVDRDSAIYFGNVSPPSLPFVIRANGADKLSVTAANTNMFNDLRINNVGLRSKLFMEGHEVFRVDQGTALVMGDVANAGLGVTFRTSGADRLVINAAGTNSTFTGLGVVSVPVLEIRGGADISESFNVEPCAGAPDVQPGMVVCINPLKSGELIVSSEPYAKTVAGILSGAGGLPTGLIMGHEGSIASGKHAVALTGRVYCMVDATNAAIEPGDMLTTSATPGHAMKAVDHTRAMGAVIGKAMTPLAQGQKGLVLVLVNLQ